MTKIDIKLLLLIFSLTSYTVKKFYEVKVEIKENKIDIKNLNFQNKQLLSYLIEKNKENL